MSLVLMVLAIEAQVSPRRVPNHLVRPFKEWFVFYLLKNLELLYLIVHLLVPIRVCFQGFTFSHG